MKTGYAYINISTIPVNIVKNAVETLVRIYKYEDKYNLDDNVVQPDVVMNYLVIKDGKVFKDYYPEQYPNIVKCETLSDFLNEAILIQLPCNINGVEAGTIIYRDGNSHYIVVEYPYFLPNERVDPKKFYNTVNKVTDVLLKNGNTIISIVHDSSADLFIIFYS
jgi:hypothetical protein